LFHGKKSRVENPVTLYLILYNNLFLSVATDFFFGQDGIKSVATMDEIQGDWWVIRGVNCGESPYPGGYDWYPCQHERFIR
jgi:hypothetical protein